MIESIKGFIVFACTRSDSFAYYAMDLIVLCNRFEPEQLAYELRLCDRSERLTSTCIQAISL